MPNWIKIRANDIRRSEMEKKAQRDRQLESTAQFKAKTDPFWNALLTVLAETVQDFNAEFPEAERRIDLFEKTPSSLLIRRTTYPSVALKIQLNNLGTSVQYSISRTQRKGMDPVERQATFGYSVNNGEAGYADGGICSHEDVAKLFLEPFFEF